MSLYVTIQLCQSFLPGENNDMNMVFDAATYILQKVNISVKELSSFWDVAAQRIPPLGSID